MLRSQRGRRAFLLPALLGAAVLVPLGLGPAASARPASGTVGSAAVEQMPILRGALHVESFSVGGIEGDASATTALSAVPFRPTVDAATYAALKQGAGAGSPDAARSSSVDGAPKPKKKNFKGIDQTESPFRPPDTHAATGMSNIVEVSNTRIAVYTKNGVRLSTATLNAFFGYAGPAIFDPRVVYDLQANRFIVSGVSFPEGNGTMRQFLAFSQTGDGNGAYNKYTICCVDFGGNFWDYPQLGYDANAVIVTASLFDSSDHLIDARVLGLPKAVGYSGGMFDPIDVLTGFQATLAPPIVLDAGNPHMLSAAEADNKLKLYRCTNLDKNSRACTTRPNVPVAAFTVPPPASQPGTSDRLDTLDSRFVNSSYQRGNTLYNIHSIRMGTRAGLRWYEVDTSSSTVTKSGDTTATATSFDWNASNAVNSLGEVFVTYSSTDPPNGTFPQVRITGRQPADGSMGKGKAVFTSPSFYNPSGDTVERWGDYSSVSLEPKGTNRCPAGRRAWAANEYAQTTSQWANRIARIGYC
jgi:hypothetical protein